MNVYLMTGIEKWLKNTSLFKRKILVIPKMEEIGLFGFKINFLKTILKICSLGFPEIVPIDRH